MNLKKRLVMWRVVVNRVRCVCACENSPVVPVVPVVPLVVTTSNVYIEQKMSKVFKT